MVPVLLLIAFLPFLLMVCHAQCSSGGYSCVSNCQQLILCVDLGGSAFSQTNIRTCDANTFCNSTSKRCDAFYCVDPNIQDPFTCSDVGLFPDPFDCTHFHFCVAPNEPSFPSSCDAGTAFNLASGNCDLPTTDRTCVEGVIPPCLEVGQSGALVENENVFYMCQINDQSRLQARFYRCQSGRVYDNTRFQCVVPVEVTPSTGGITTTTVRVTTAPEGTTISTEGTTISTEGITSAEELTSTGEATTKTSVQQTTAGVESTNKSTWVHVFFVIVVFGIKINTVDIIK